MSRRVIVAQTTPEAKLFRRAPSWRLKPPLANVCQPRGRVAGKRWTAHQQ
jgi:hypothetical protein